MSKRKICCFCERWASGGIESFLYSVLCQGNLTELEVDVVVAQLERNSLMEALEAMGVRFIELSGRLRDLRANHRAFRLLLQQRRYDAVHFNLYQGLSLYYVRIARQEGVPVRIVHAHNAALRKSPSRGLKLLLHRWGRLRFTKEASALWACSGAAADFLFDRADRKVTFIPNGVDTRRFRYDPAVREALRRELGLTDCLVLGNVGRLCGQKNQVFLLEVFAQLVQACPDSRLLLVGDGEDRQMLQLRARELGIAKKTVFYGYTERIEQLLWVMDVFGLPSLFEGLSVAAVEAQAAGLPVLCARGLSPEVKLTDRLCFLPLEAKPWAEEVLNMASRNTNREQYAETVRNAGFEAREVAQKIWQVYLGEDYGAANRFDHCSGL